MLSAEDNELLTRTGPGTPMGDFFRRFYRTREHLGPTDAAIVQFRRLMLRGARELGQGVEPSAARNGAAYAVRSGSAVADRSVSFAEVMVERFGDPLGRAPSLRVGASARP